MEKEVFVTVAFSTSVPIKLDPARMDDEEYLDEKRDEARIAAADNVETKARNGFVIGSTEEEFDAIVE